MPRMRKTCARCKQAKLPEEFNKQARSLDGLQSWCRECARWRNAQRYRGQTVQEAEAAALATPADADGWLTYQTAFEYFAELAAEAANAPAPEPPPPLSAEEALERQWLDLCEGN